jgi:hypothetical protein
MINSHHTSSPFNYAVGVPNGSDFVVKAMQLSIEKFIDYPQHTNKLPTRAAIFFNLTNQFNSVSREEFFNVIETSFPKLFPLTKLFYNKANTVHHKWDDRTWRTLLMKEGVSQGCHSHPYLLPSLSHDFSNQSTHSYANEQRHD